MTELVHIVYTGGTIGMMPSEDGFAPVPGAFPEMLAALPELGRDRLPTFSISELDPLLDSANMTPADWNRIAEEIATRYDDVGGFVVLHGTDTMAYTASALSFMLESLRKPVVLTGSQIPLCRVRNDARRNLVDAMIVAAEFSIPEVMIVFDGKLMRGNRATKVSANSLAAFASPNQPLLGRIGTSIEVDHDEVRRPPRGRLSVRRMNRSHVGSLRLFPGIRSDLVRNVLKPPLQGLIIEAYGVGNAPSRDRDLLAAIREATDRGVVVAVCSQCLEGSVELGDYATGRSLLEAGAVGALDMTPEAAMTKLMYLLEREDDVSEVRRLLRRSLRGELTAPENE